MNKLLNISEAANLAIHALIILADNPDQMYNTKEIAAALSSSENHLAKIFQLLAKQDYVKSIRGPKGGFTFNKAKKDVTLLEVLELIDGKIDPTPCLFDHPICKAKKCVLGNLITKVSNEITDALYKTKLSDLKIKFEINK